MTCPVFFWLFRYPDTAAQRFFFQNYLTLEELQQASTSGSLDQHLERLSAEANVFALASHVYWGVWAVVQARYSPIDFDYFDYSAMRWGEYHRRKQQAMADARRVFGEGGGVAQS